MIVNWIDAHQKLLWGVGCAVILTLAGVELAVDQYVAWRNHRNDAHQS